MKTIFIFLTVFLSQCAPKQTEKAMGENTVEVSDTILLNTKEFVTIGNGYEMKISKFVSDSRCPEGVNCVWIGQVEMNIAVYKSKKLVEEKLILVTSTTFEENKKWFAKYIFSNNKSIASIEVKPNRVKDIEIKENEYLLEILSK